MRSAIACMAVLILAAAGVFSWQRSQNAGLRAQIAEQRQALQDNQMRVEDLSLQLAAQNRIGSTRRLSASDVRVRQLKNEAAAARADERRVILDEYAGVIAQMNLPEPTASRLQDLLTDRIETVLDAQDSAREEGFAEGSAETERAVAFAVDEVNRNIATLVGLDGIRRLDGLPANALPESSLVPQQVAPTVNVTVIVQASPAPAYADSTSVPADSDAGPLVSAYPYFPVAGFVTFPRPFHYIGGARAAPARPHHFSNRLAER